MVLAADAGVWSIGAYRRGPLESSTPNVDRLAREGALLTDYYAQPSAAAGRAALLTGQSPFRVGLSPREEDPTIPALLRGRGYAAARFGAGGPEGRDGPGPLEPAQVPGDPALAGSLEFVERSARAGRPFFLWHEAQAPRPGPRLPAGWGSDPPAGGMAELDHVVGRLLGRLDEIGIATETIVVLTSLGGAESFSWPEGRNGPFRGEKGTTWEGGFRVPCLVRWPGVIQPGSVVSEVMSHEDWLPTLLAASGHAGVKAGLLAGMRTGGRRYRAHLDGYDFLPFFAGEAHRGPRREIFYFDPEGNLNALRYGDHKVSMWLTGPIVTDLRRDPVESLHGSWSVREWGDKAPAQAMVAGFLKSLESHPPRTEPGPFGVRQFLEALQAAAAAPGAGPTSAGRPGGPP